MSDRQLTRRRLLSTGVAVGAMGSAGCVYTEESDTGPVDDIPQKRYNSANTGHAPDERAPKTGPLSTISGKWQSDRLFVDAAASGRLYGRDEERVVVVDSQDGTELASFEMGATINTLTVSDGTIFAPCEDGYLYALNAEDGSEEWAFETNTELFTQPRVFDGTVFTETGGIVYALDTSDGSLRWRIEPDDVTSTTAITDEGVCFQGSETLYCHERSSGSNNWEFEHPDPPSTGVMTIAPAISDGVAYAGLKRSLFAVRMDDGSERWSFEADDIISTTPTVSDRAVYLGSHDDHVYALDRADGTVNWSKNVEDDVNNIVLVDGVLFISSRTENTNTALYALDPESGSVQWSTGDSRGFYSPIVSNGVLYTSGTYLEALTESPYVG